MSDTLQAQYELLCSHARETALLRSIESLLNWDERTLLPPKAGAYRAEQVTYLSGLVHQRQTDPRIGEWLAELEQSALAADADSDTAATLRELRRQYAKKTRLPQSLVEELSRTAVLGQQAWVEARRGDDFAAFRPLLEKTLELKRQEADALGYEECRYDALLDDYEPGERTAAVTAILGRLREELVDLVGAIRDCPGQPDMSILKRHYPVPAQEAFGKQVAARLGFDFDRGRLDVTHHPFCSEAGPHDHRITTRYDARFFPSGFFSILHEAGHGIYEQGLPTDHYGLPLGQFTSMGIHESQSRMWENLVGRSRAFWDHFYREAQRAFPEALSDVRVDEFHFAVNDVRPSLIRVEADEVTYNLHIILRFELEQALIAGDLSVADLPAAWNDKYREYLGIEPPNDADGVLQDIHWSAGLFGYFPTYSLGNLYAAQFFAQAEADLGSLHEQFARGEFLPLRDWLREKIHAQGQRFTAAQLVEHVTGRPLACDDLINYLAGKMEPLYSNPPQPSTPDATESRETPVDAGSAMAAIMAAAAGVAIEEQADAEEVQAESPGDEADGRDRSESEADTSVETAATDESATDESAVEAAADADQEDAAAGEREPSEADEESEHDWQSEDAEAEHVGADFDVAAAIQATPRPQQYEIGMMGNMIGIVVFGFIGLALGYYLLNLFGGPRFNFLDVPLPFINHTQRSEVVGQVSPSASEETSTERSAGTTQPEGASIPANFNGRVRRALLPVEFETGKSARPTSIPSVEV